MFPFMMTEDYWIYMENLSLSSFSQLMEAARYTNVSVKKTLKSNLMIRFMLKKKTYNCDYGEEQGSQRLHFEEDAA